MSGERDSLSKEKKLTYVIDFISSDVVSIKNKSSGRDDLEIEVVKQHLVGHDSIRWIHPHDSCLHWSSVIVNLNEMRDLLIGKDLCFDDMES
jgi:hypothetical protein